MVHILKTFVTSYILPFFLMSLAGAAGAFAALVIIDEIQSRLTAPIMTATACVIMLAGITVLRLRRTPSRTQARISFALFTLFALIDALAIVATHGSFHGAPMTVLSIFAFPMAPLIALFLMADMVIAIHIVVGIVLLWNAVLTWIKADTPRVRRELVGIIASATAFTLLSTVSFLDSPAHKYKGHGFDYMNGYSSTDFTDYTPYADNSKLAILDHTASLTIDDEKDMPRLDGAEACYPLYSSVAKNVYTNIGDIEKKARNSDYQYENGKIVTFTNSAQGYARLLDGEVDMFFGAKPSQDMLELAKDEGKEFQLTPIGHEAFVFFVEEDNPVDNITSEDVRKIYSGDITNWKELGGSDQEIVAFQRPEESGSQIMMKHYMGDVPLKKPMTYEVFNSMSGVIDVVAEYGHEKGAIGYTFRYFLEGLHHEDRVKMVSIDGVYPSIENIRNGSYPLIGDVYCVTLTSNNDPHVRDMIDFLLSPDGQELVERSGYSPLS